MPAWQDRKFNKGSPLSNSSNYDCDGNWWSSNALQLLLSKTWAKLLNKWTVIFYWEKFYCSCHRWWTGAHWISKDSSFITNVVLTVRFLNYADPPSRFLLENSNVSAMLLIREDRAQDKSSRHPLRYLQQRELLKKEIIKTVCVHYWN